MIVISVVAVVIDLVLITLDAQRFSPLNRPPIVVLGPVRV